MKKIFTLLLLSVSLYSQSQAQSYNNEWIHFNQTYYKFKVVTTGLYRIPKAVLDGAGIGNTAVENFELWRNGQPVPFYPSVASGTLPSDGYLEFWGEKNDGKPDKPLYRDPAYQHSDSYSLESDTATYFLSVNTSQAGFLVRDRANNIAGNSLSAEPYFMYTIDGSYKNRINPGLAADVGELVYSASYDKGEFWSSALIAPTNPLTASNGNLYVYSGGPDAQLRFGAAGTSLNSRNIQVKVNGNLVADTAMNFYGDVNLSTTVPLGTISSGSASIQFYNTSSVSSDKMCVSYYKLTYPRQFNFGGLKSFVFSLPAKSDGYYLEITNFNTGSVAPALYDLSSGNRYMGDIAVSGKVRFALPALSTDTRFVLVNEQAANIGSISSLTARTFTDFSNTANQGNYLIISNPVLYSGTNGNNPVQDYADYRSSAAGGGYNAMVVNIGQLIDQFAFGIANDPLSVKNFLRYARAKFTTPPAFVFLIGRGVDYVDYYAYRAQPVLRQLALVPTFGHPASDALLSSDDGASPIAITPIGRLPAISGSEIEDYLAKVKEYESVQRNAANTIADRDWMKKVVHVTGVSESYLGSVLCNYMYAYKQLIEDTLYGADVQVFCKNTSNPVETLTNDRIAQLFSGGVSVFTYFGHSSSSTLAFNLDNPDAYDNQGKYPVFFVNGCQAGDFFGYAPERTLGSKTLSETYVLAKERGSIAFVASTHFGIVNYLNIYLNQLYKAIGTTDYGKSLGQLVRDGMQGLVNVAGPYDFYARLHAEEMCINGDPSLKLNLEKKPDYDLEESEVQIDPAFISVGEKSFSLKIRIENLGKAVNDSITLEVKQQYPDGSTGIVYRNKIPGIHYADSVTLLVPIVATRDKGFNRLTITIDADNAVDETDETNNTVTKEFYIYENEVRPIFPYDYSIVNDPAQKFYASTANPFSPQLSYVMEMDTTELFNSSLKVSKTLSSTGGLLEFNPGLAFADSTVYYWRVAPVPAPDSPYHWNGASFVYINGGQDGFNQSHYFQMTHSDYQRIRLDSATRKLKFNPTIINLFAKNAMYPTSGAYDEDFSVTVNGNDYIQSACVGQSLIFNVFSPTTFKAWRNVDNSGNNLYSSGSGSANCAANRYYNFEFPYTTAASRKNMMNFMDSVPDGYYVLVRSVDYNVPKSYAATWQADTSLYGSNNSLYHRLLAAGFQDIDSLNAPKDWLFIYRKNDPSFTPKYVVSKGIYDKISLSADCPIIDSLGFISSPEFGPAKAWKKVIWRGSSEETPSSDNPSVDVIGVDPNGTETTLYSLDRNTQDFDISSVDASQYPYMKLRMRDIDSVNQTPYQLRYWRIFYDPAPEGAIAPNLYFTSRDTVALGDSLTLAVAFRNVSKYAFDSLSVKVIITGSDNVSHTIVLPKQKPLVSGDSLILRIALDTRSYKGDNTLFVNVNPDNDQPEQYLFNNFLYRKFYVVSDQTDPVMDVTFDGVHILNRDIVSAKPHIQIKLTDEDKYLLLNDTSLFTVQLQYPDGSLRAYSFANSDTLRFTPAPSGSDNVATIDFYPALTTQYNASGDEYSLIVKAKDATGNKAGGTGQYSVAFRVINKPMISNLLNYPNPFSTSTAFVFTITGSEVPQNMKIQILTVTGKIVREITKDELGPIHIGRNITEFKWNGTDQYGDKLANGVYLYRFVTSLNGRRMDKFTDSGDNTDQYFNNGYGKMYLMR